MNEEQTNIIVRNDDQTLTVRDGERVIYTEQLQHVETD
jgi:hypothetical protein